MSVFRPLYKDPFAPTLLSSPPLPVTQEQTTAIKAVLDVACSDSFFASKAYAAINLILTGGSIIVPTVTSLVPNSVELGSPSFTLHLHGVGFTPSSIIVFAGQEEPTTFISTKEVTTGVNMDVWLGPDTLPVMVANKEGVLSAPQMFTFVSPESESSARVAMGGTFHAAPSHAPYSPVSVPELHEPPSVKIAKEHVTKEEKK